MVAPRARWTDVMGTSVRRITRDNAELRAQNARLRQALIDAGVPAELVDRIAVTPSTCGAKCDDPGQCPC